MLSDSVNLADLQSEPDDNLNSPAINLHEELTERSAARQQTHDHYCEHGAQVGLQDLSTGFQGLT